MIVAFDTVFEQCSVAVCSSSCHTLTKDGKRGQTEDILPLLDECLSHQNATIAEVSAWAFNRGPGAFSGIRINTAVAQALSVANGALCVPVSSLHTLAHMAHDQLRLVDGVRIVAIMDARQDQVYAGFFVIKDAQVVPDPSYDEHEKLLDYGDVIDADWVVGDGVALISTQAKHHVGKPNASHVAQLARLMMQDDPDCAVSADRALPVYLRNNAWKTLAEQAQARADKADKP